MLRLRSTAVFVGLALATPLAALGQTVPMPVIPAVRPIHPAKRVPNAALWQGRAAKVTLMAKGHAGAVAPVGAAGLAEGRMRSAKAGVRLVTKPGVTAHLDVDETRWLPVIPTCLPGATSCEAAVPADGVRRTEVGAGYAGHGVELNLAVGHAQSDTGISAAQASQLRLPRVLPMNAGADVAAPLWFRDSTSTNLSAHGRLALAPNTSVDLGASVGQVRFLPGSGVAGNDALDQTTVSFGLQHGDVRGAIVGHVLEPALPGSTLMGPGQRWSGIDLGVSVRLPWRGELSFGAANVWTSGRAPALLGSGAMAPDQGRVPYVQYHQDLGGL